MLPTLRQRLANQDLLKPASRAPADEVRRLGAVQAQDYAGAKWALGQRCAGSTDEQVESAFADGAFVRTHVLRPTWHFVAPEDLRWMLALTAPRIRAQMAYYDRKLELTDDVVRRSNTAIVAALAGGHQLTRAELARALSRAKLGPTSGQRLGHLMMHAELDAVVCSGARRGKQFTYAPVDERVPSAPHVPREEALAMLADRYFTTRGPATAQDFSWWSGLTVADAARAARSIAPSLEHEERDGRSYWWRASEASGARRSPAVHLLPNYDEYFIGLKDRSAFGGRVERVAPDGRTAALSAHIVVIDGEIVGGWKRMVTGKRVAVELQLLARITPAERRAVADQAVRHAAFFDLELTGIRDS
jgi:hypothetical protein